MHFLCISGEYQKYLAGREQIFRESRTNGTKNKTSNKHLMCPVKNQKVASGRNLKNQKTNGNKERNHTCGDWKKNLF